MAYRTWDPFRELEQLRREMERAFEAPANRPGSQWRGAFLPAYGARAYPLVNVDEDTDNVYIEALAPGLDPETLEATVQRDQLRLAGEKKSLDDNITPEAFHRNERAAGRFVRTLTLPTEVDNDKIEATYTDGILKVTMPKAEEAKPKQISVSVS